MPARPCPPGIRRLPRVRPPGPRIPAGALRHLPLRATGGVFLQETGIMPGAPSPSCGARRMDETAALLTDEVFPSVPLRQWVISLIQSTRSACGAGFPFPLRYLFAAHSKAIGKVLGIVYRAISTHLIHKAGCQLEDGATGAVTPARSG